MGLDWYLRLEFLWGSSTSSGKWSNRSSVLVSWFINARLEGTVFHRRLSVHPRGGSTYPGRGVPTLVRSRWRGGYLTSLGSTYPGLVPPSQGRYPPTRVGTPSPTRTDQQSEHLLPSRQYASLNGDTFCRFFRITRELKKNPVAKCYPK